MRGDSMYYKRIHSIKELLGDEGLWRLPEYLSEEFIEDEQRKNAIETAKKVLMRGGNVLIYGSPGTGKTALMFKILTETFKWAGVGVVDPLTENIGDEHVREGVVIFIDDLPRLSEKALRSIFIKRVSLIVATARLEELKFIERVVGENPFRHFVGIELKGMSEEKLREMLIRYANREGINLVDEEAINIVVNKASGLPVYIWQVIRELKIVKKDLTKDFALRIPQGMYDYVDDILWRVIGDHEDRYNVLLALLLMTDMPRYRMHQDLFNASFVIAKRESMGRQVGLKEALLSDILDSITRYLAREADTYSFRLPHDSWADVLRGRSNGPMSGEISRINTLFPYAERRRIIIQAAILAWEEILSRIKDPLRKNTFIINLRSALGDRITGLITDPEGRKQILKEMSDEIIELINKGADLKEIKKKVSWLLMFAREGEILNLLGVNFLRKWEQTKNDELFNIGMAILRRANIPKALYNMAKAFLMKKDFASAYNLLRKYLEAAHDADAYYNMAIACIGLGRYDEALNYLNVYLSQNPKDKNAKKVLEILASESL